MLSLWYVLLNVLSWEDPEFINISHLVSVYFFSKSGTDFYRKNGELNKKQSFSNNAQQCLMSVCWLPD